MAGWMGTGGWSAAVPVIQTNALGVGTAPGAAGTVTLTGALLWATDNTADIGASGANRPRDLYLGRSLGVGTAASGTSGRIDLAAGALVVAAAQTIQSWSAGDGTMQFINNGSTGFNRLILGKNDASANGSSWNLNAGVLEAKTGDATAYTRVDALGSRAFGATSGIGYGTGAGGTVTQATSKSTGVTLNTATGQITMNAAALAASTTVSFVLTNSAIAASDLVVLNHVSAGTAGAYTLNSQPAAGSATINVRNVSLGSLSEAIVIGYAVVKAVTS